MYRFNLLLLLAFLSVSVVLGDAVDHALAKEEKRQVSLSTGVSITLPGDGSTTATTSSITTTSASSASSTTSSASSTTTSSSTTSSSTTTTTSSSSSPSPTSTFISSSATTSESVTRSSTTRSSSSSSSATSRSSTTPTPSALAANGEGGSPGLSDSSKKIIGGVVGGVGGALLVGALAFTAWRIWGKKKEPLDDDFYSPNPEKLSTSTDNTPFRSTLDRYHDPGPVSASSNF